MKLRKRTRTTTNLENANATKRGVRKRKRRRPNEQGTWNWLLASDGTPLTVDIKAVVDIETVVVDTLDAEIQDDKAEWFRPDTDTRIIPTTKHRNRENDSNSNSNSSPSPLPSQVVGWSWIKAPDGTPSTVGTSPCTTVASELERTLERLAETNFSSVPGQSWNWLLAKDDQPATVEVPIPTTRVFSVATATFGERGTERTRTRKRSQEAETLQNYALRPRPRRLHRADLQGNEEEDEADVDDGHSEIDCESECESEIETDSETYDCDTDIELELQPMIENSRLWTAMYRKLVEYKDKYKTVRVPRGYKADPQLAAWVLQERYSCKKKHRIDLLNDIGFEW